MRRSIYPKKTRSLAVFWKKNYLFNLKEFCVIQDRVKMLQFTLILFTAFITYAPSNVASKDPVYAVPTYSSETIPIGSHNPQYSIVNLLWFRYLSQHDDVNADDPPSTKIIYITLKNVPKNLFINFTNTVGRRVSQRAIDPALQRRYILTTADKVLRDFLDIVGIKNYRINLNAVDPSGVYLTPNSLGSFDSIHFNRTFTLSFEVPPYGQSLPNRVVTNINNPWSIDADKLSMTFRRFIDTVQMPNVNDLRYRYYHNFGHSLGFGHFRGFYEHELANIANDNSASSSYDKIRTSRNRDRPTVFRRRSTTLNRSVMFADTRNQTHASNFLTRLDERLLPLILRNHEKIMESFRDRLLTNEIPERVYDLYELLRYVSP